MFVFTSVFELTNYLKKQRKVDKWNTIGFVPTMGALHEGHLSLIEHAKEKSEVVICSIFVNPTQFNNEKDLETYPINLEEDKASLKSVECDVLFCPSAKEIYPNGVKEKFEINFDGLDKVMEGFYRPGHFEGVAMVVEKLLNIVQPDFVFLGRKDFQQVAIIQQMIAFKGLKVKINVVPTKRNRHGLALSSRNMLLSEKELTDALIISKTLFLLRKRFSDLALEELLELGKSEIAKSSLKLEYLEIVSDETLRPPISKNQRITCCIVAYCGGVRLIDNIPLNYEI